MAAKVIRLSAASHAGAGRAIVTFARGWQTLVAVRSLGRRGVEVIAGDQYALTPASLSKYSVATFRYPDPTRHPEAFLDTLETVVRQHKPPAGQPYVLMPIHKESYLIAQHRARFEPHIRLALPEINQIQQVHNKGALAAYAQARGLPIPQTWLPGSVAEFRAQLKEFRLPAFVKVREAASGVGVRRVSTRAELEKTFLDFAARYSRSDADLPIIQEAVPGSDYCVATLFNRGRLVACMTYHNLRAYPARRGAGVLRETVSAPAMEQIAADTLGPLGWHGVAELDFRWDGRAQTTPKLIEVNPRFWGGLNQAVVSGWDYPWLLFQLAATGRVELPNQRRTDVRTETPILAFLATLQEMARSERGDAALRAGLTAARREFRLGSKRAGWRALWRGLKEGLGPRQRLREAQRVLHDHRDTVYDVLCRDDPGPALGIFFPLAVFLKHGKVNLELMTGESGSVAKTPQKMS